MTLFQERRNGPGRLYVTIHPPEVDEVMLDKNLVTPYRDLLTYIGN